VANENPGSFVLGVDLSPVQPLWVPPNVRFEIDDVEKTWTFPPDSLDFVHIRDMDGAIQDWSNVMKEAYQYVYSQAPQVTITPSLSFSVLLAKYIIRRLIVFDLNLLEH
jgi:hypothetical protein